MGRYPSSKIVYFEIGPFLYDRILNGSINKETFINLVNKLDSKEITNQVAKEIIPMMMEKDINLDEIIITIAWIQKN